MTKLNRNGSLLLIALLTLLSATSVAQQNDLSQPINIDADRAEVDYQANTSRYTGNVELRQGSIRVRADEVLLSKAGQGRISARLSGSPATYNQTLDDGTPVSASASGIVYGAQPNMIELNGNARITRGADKVAAQNISYNIATGRTVGSGRVSVTITPPAANN